MRAGIDFTVTPEDRRRLEAVVRDRNRPQKHVWRARIILLTSEGLGTNRIVRETGKDKTAVWRWQERSMHEGVDGLLRDKTRPPGKPPLPEATVARVSGTGRQRSLLRSMYSKARSGAWGKADQQFPVYSLIWHFSSLIRRVGNWPENSRQFSSLPIVERAESGRIRECSLYFPCISGKYRQRRVRSSLPAPPLPVKTGHLIPDRCV